MTLGMAWSRNLGSIRELVVASDSRLSGGQFWDANPKIMLLPRSDCVLSFAGKTYDAYPLMLQAANAIETFNKLRTRATDLAALKGHLLRVFNRSREFISCLPQGQARPDPADATFLLSGYSWRVKQFRIWKLHFDSSIQRYTFRPTHDWPGQKGAEAKLIAFVGDQDAIDEAKSMLVERLRAGNRLSSGGLDMEPFSVLRDIIRSQRFPSVGGSPQVAKVYEHMNAYPFGVYWPDRSTGMVCLLGRPLMPYEKPPSGIIDPDDLLTVLGRRR
jgi:hypothetical protein